MPDCPVLFKWKKRLCLLALYMAVIARPLQYQVTLLSSILSWSSVFLSSSFMVLHYLLVLLCPYIVFLLCLCSTFLSDKSKNICKATTTRQTFFLNFLSGNVLPVPILMFRSFLFGLELLCFATGRFSYRMVRVRVDYNHGQKNMGMEMVKLESPRKGLLLNIFLKKLFSLLFRQPNNSVREFCILKSILICKKSNFYLNETFQTQYFLQQGIFCYNRNLQLQSFTEIYGSWENSAKFQKFQSLARMLTIHLSVNSDGFSWKKITCGFKISGISPKVPNILQKIVV